MATFYLDDGIALDLATELFRLGHPATTSQAEGVKSAPDEQHLWLATQGDWTLVTQNARDFRMLHRAWQLWGVPRPHAGILVIDQVPRVLVPQAAQDLDSFVQQGLPLSNRLYHSASRAGCSTHSIWSTREPRHRGPRFHRGRVIAVGSRSLNAGMPQQRGVAVRWG